MNWIDVKEKLPKEYEFILMFKDNHIFHGIMTLEFEDESEIFHPSWHVHGDSWNYVQEIDNISHWIYLKDVDGPGQTNPHS